LKVWRDHLSKMQEFNDSKGPFTIEELGKVLVPKENVERLISAIERYNNPKKDVI
jgi:hypothetical protein